MEELLVLLGGEGNITEAVTTLIAAVIAFMAARFGYGKFVDSVAKKVDEKIND